MAVRYDVAISGGGHNGLVAAGHLGLYQAGSWGRWS